MHHNLDPDECVGRMRQRVFDETKLTVSAGIAANKVGFQPFLYQLADFHRRFPDASQSMHFFRLLTEHNLTVHVSVAQICSDKVRIYVINRRLLSPNTSSFLTLE